MRAILLWGFFIMLVITSNDTSATQTNTSNFQSQQKTSSQTSPPANTAQELREEIEQLKSTVSSQGKQLELQKLAFDLIAQPKQSNNTAMVTAFGIVLAAAIAGFFAIRNQNRQAAQERLLKAVELIMDSRSGYQADIRRQNLDVFLDEPARKHLEDIKEKFSGPEYTDLLLSLAQAMSDKAASPDKVLKIWQSVLKHKNIFHKITYPNMDQHKST